MDKPLHEEYEFNDPEDLRELVEETADLLGMVNRLGIHDNKAQMMKLAAFNGIVVMLASDRLRDDDELMELAVKNTGIAFQFASERLRNNRHLALTAMESWPPARDWIGDELKEELRESNDD